MKYDIKSNNWSRNNKSVRYYYAEDRRFYDVVVWSLVAFMVGLVVATVLVVGGVI